MPWRTVGWVSPPSGENFARFPRQAAGRRGHGQCSQQRRDFFLGGLISPWNRSPLTPQLLRHKSWVFL